MNRSVCMSMLIVLLLALTSCTRPTPQPPTSAPPTPTIAATILPATTVPVTVLPPGEPATDEPVASSVDLAATIAASPALSTLRQAVMSADLVEKLATAGPYTIFAPTDDAFAALPAGALDDPDVLMDVLLLHIVEGELAPESQSFAGNVTSLLGEELTLSSPASSQGAPGLQVNGQPITSPAIKATNGLIYLIDTVMLPASPNATP
ncbi:MAG: fasciclin domain-containing protein [Caldilineaceae bacterium]|nr:fasciclin domain-containing protein [Caldilineaceae bacterium]